MLTRIFISPFRKKLRCLPTIYSYKQYKSPEETKTVMDIVLIGYEKEAEFKTFATEDLVIGLVCVEVAQDTKLVNSPSLTKVCTVKAPATVNILSAVAKVLVMTGISTLHHILIAPALSRRTKL